MHRQVSGGSSAQAVFLSNYSNSINIFLESQHLKNQMSKGCKMGKQLTGSMGTDPPFKSFGKWGTTEDATSSAGLTDDRRYSAEATDVSINKCPRIKYNP